MGLWDKLFGEFVDVIEWTDDSNDTMVYRFERYGNEIKYGAKLTVRESQVAVFVNEGQVADELGPGLYELETKNLPILSTLQHWDHGFSSPFKAEVYFCSTRRFTDLKWGTKNALMLRDQEFGAVRLRAFGTYGVRIGEPVRFIREIVGTDGHFTVDEISQQLRNMIISRLSNVVGGAGIPVLDLAANYDQLGEFVTRRIAPEFAEYGLYLTKLLVENISLPPAVEEALDKRTSMGIIGNLDRYLQFQSAEAMEAAAANPGGDASSGLGVGLGVVMAQRMGENLGRGRSDADQPPPVPREALFYLAEGGRATGPFGTEELRRRAAGGDLTGESLVWRKGMSGWLPARDVPQLASLLAPDSPPPIPPS